MVGTEDHGSGARDPLRDFLARQERSVLSRLGAGVTGPKLVTLDRWSRELAEDMRCSTEEARRFNEWVSGELATSVQRLDEPRSRVAAARIIYAHIRANLSGAPRPRAVSSGKHMVYQLFDAVGTLLYIGITDRGPLRLVEHYRKKPWFGDVAEVQFERYETRAESEAREARLIRDRAPLYNIQHNLGRQVA